MCLVKTRSTLISLAALFLLGCQPPVPNLDSRGSTIVAFGDSITFGVGVPESRSYPSTLAERLDVEVINAGIPGDTSSDGLARLAEVLEYDPWLVIVEFGGNDLLQKRPLKETEAALRGILEQLLEEGVIPILVEIHGPFGGDMEDLFEDLAEAYDVPLVEDILPKILRTPRWKSDPIHPNDAGYAALAAEVGDLVEDLVSRRERLR